LNSKKANTKEAEEEAIVDLFQDAKTEEEDPDEIVYFSHTYNPPTQHAMASYLILTEHLPNKPRVQTNP
jgi:hypothetical protein